MEAFKTAGFCNAPIKPRSRPKAKDKNKLSLRPKRQKYRASANKSALQQGQPERCQMSPRMVLQTVHTKEKTSDSNGLQRISGAYIAPNPQAVLVSGAHSKAIYLLLRAVLNSVGFAFCVRLLRPRRSVSVGVLQIFD